MKLNSRGPVVTFAPLDRAQVSPTSPKQQFDTEVSLWTCRAVTTIVTPFWETFGRLAVRGRETRAQQRSVWKCTEGSRDSSRYLQNQSLANPIWITLFRNRKILVRQPEVGVDRIRKEIISPSGINPLPVIVFLDGLMEEDSAKPFLIRPQIGC